MHCTLLYSTVLIAPYHTNLHCTALYCTAINCTRRHFTALHFTALKCIALYSTELQKASSTILQNSIFFSPNFPPNFSSFPPFFFFFEHARAYHFYRVNGTTSNHRAGPILRAKLPVIGWDKSKGMSRVDNNTC